MTWFWVGCRCSSWIIFLYVPHKDHRSQKLFWKIQKIKRGHEEGDLFFTYFWVFLNCLNYRSKTLPLKWIELRGMYFEREEVFFSLTYLLGVFLGVSKMSQLWKFWCGWWLGSQSQSRSWNIKEIKSRFAPEENRFALLACVKYKLSI